MAQTLTGSTMSGFTHSTQESPAPFASSKASSAPSCPGRRPGQSSRSPRVNFPLKVVDAQLEFVADDAWPGAGLLLHQGGWPPQAARISDTVVKRDEIVLPAATLVLCVGTHELRPGFALAITVAGDRFLSEATGQAEVPLFAGADGKPCRKGGDAQFVFSENASGAVRDLVRHPRGRDRPGARKP